MTSWETIKAAFVKSSRPGSVGFLKATRTAATLYVSLRGHLSDLDDADAAFNADEDVSQTIVIGDALEAV